MHGAPNENNNGFFIPTLATHTDRRSRHETLIVKPLLFVVPRSINTTAVDGTKSSSVKAKHGCDKCLQRLQKNNKNAFFVVRM